MGTWIILIIFGLFIYYIVKNLFSSNRNDDDEGSYTVTFQVKNGGYEYDDGGNYYDRNDVEDQGAFFSKGSSINMFNSEFQDPLAYFSTQTKGKYSELPFLIHAGANVAESESNEELGYWPSFSEIKPGQRRKFLNWLSNGKDDPNMDLGYIFIYFYGLEYRALKEGKDRRGIFFELIRLLEIYGYNRSFKSYSENLITHIILKESEFDDIFKKNILEYYERTSKFSPLHTHGVIFHIDKDKELDGDRLFEMVSGFEEIGRSKIPDKLGDIFKKHFLFLVEGKLEEFKKDIQLKKRRLDYHPASRYRFSSWVSERNRWLPRKHINFLVKSWKQAIGDLKKYSLRMNKAEKGELYNYLPDNLKEIYSHPLEEHFDNFIGNNNSVVAKFGEIAEALNALYKEKYTLKESKEIANTLNDLGYGVEPDPNYFNKSLKWEDHTAIFKLGQAQFDKLEGPNYSTASMLFDIGANVAHADGQFDEREQQTILRFLNNNICQKEIEKKHLKYRAEIYQDIAPTMTGLVKKLKNRVKLNEIKKLGQYMLDIAIVDGEITSSEFKVIKDIFSGLGLDRAFLDGLITGDSKYKISLAEKNVVMKIGKGRDENGLQIPKEKISIEVDHGKIEYIMNDTKEVQEILAKTFNPEDDINKALKEEEKEQQVMALSNKMAAFMDKVIEKSQWPKDELKKVAIEMDILINDGIDQVNSYCDDKYGDYLIFETEIYIIQKDLLKAA